MDRTRCGVVVEETSAVPRVSIAFDDEEPDGIDLGSDVEGLS
jgi:hypothetical protein